MIFRRDRKELVRRTGAGAQAHLPTGRLGLERLVAAAGYGRSRLRAGEVAAAGALDATLGPRAATRCRKTGIETVLTGVSLPAQDRAAEKSLTYG